MKKNIIFLFLLAAGCSSKNVNTNRTCEFTCKNEGLIFIKSEKMTCSCKQTMEKPDIKIEMPVLKTKTVK